MTILRIQHRPIAPGSLKAVLKESTLSRRIYCVYGQDIEQYSSRDLIAYCGDFGLGGAMEFARDADTRETFAIVEIYTD